MTRPKNPTTTLTVRIGSDLERSLDSEARRRRASKSEVVREILSSGLALARTGADLPAEARRQSLLVSERGSEAETLDFLEEIADTRGWE